MYKDSIYFAPQVSVERRDERNAMEGSSQVAAAFGIGVALAAAPGPVQAVVLSESVGGGVGRGLRAVAGVHLTFAALLVVLALGLSVASPHGVTLRALQVAGGALLLWLAWDGFRAAQPTVDDPGRRRRLSPAVRGMLAILLNPGGWLFLGAVASPLLATASQRSGTESALLAALALVLGAALGDVALAFAGGLGLRRAGSGIGRLVRLTLTMILAALGVWLIIRGAAP
jgi:L-lysine exporter family protein LysE/ArgO